MTTSRALIAARGVLALTVLGALLALADPGLAGHTPPHPALDGTITEAVWILQNNLRVLAVPFLLAALRFPESRLGRRGGDVIVAGLVAASTISVGIALGRWGQRLLPYLPQLPLEWAALAIATSAWLTARHGHAHARELAVLGATTAVLLIGAATLETWCTPHHVTGTHSAPAPVAFRVRLSAGRSAGGDVRADRHRDRVADRLAMLVVGQQREMLRRVGLLTDEPFQHRAGLPLLVEGLDKVAGAVKNRVEHRQFRLAGRNPLQPANGDKTSPGRSSVDPRHLWVPVVAFATDFAPATTRSLQGRALPFPHHVRFRSAVWPALDRATSTTDPHKEGPDAHHQRQRQHHTRARAA